MAMQRTFILLIVWFLNIACASDSVLTERVDCSTLRLGQYICPDPSIDQIDPDTQQYRGCTKGQEIPSKGQADGNYFISN